MKHIRYTRTLLLMPILAAWGCDAAEGVRVQPLPPLERPSAEARANLPEVEGEWSFAGWELAPSDSASIGTDLPALGTIALETQRLDSIAGAYLVSGGGMPIVGEVRRDSVIAMVVGAGERAGRFLTGRVSGDTLWVSLTNVLEEESWPSGGRAAFVRTAVSGTFARLEGQPTILPGDTVQPADTASTMLAGLEGDESERPDLATRIARGDLPATLLPPLASATAEARTPAAAAPQGQQPRTEPRTLPEAQTQPQEPVAAPPAAEPEPEPEPEPTVEPEPVRPRPPPRLLGEPVRRDSVPDLRR